MQENLKILNYLTKEEKSIIESAFNSKSILELESLIKIFNRDNLEKTINLLLSKNKIEVIYLINTKCYHENLNILTIKEVDEKLIYYTKMNKLIKATSKEDIRQFKNYRNDCLKYLTPVKCPLCEHEIDYLPLDIISDAKIGYRFI